MKTLLFSATMLLAGVGCTSAQTGRAQPCRAVGGGWCAAELHGLRMGESKIGEMVSRLGSPDSIDASAPPGAADTTLVLYFYTGPNGEHLEVYALPADSIVKTASEYPVGWSRADVQRRFGGPGRETRYDFDECLGDGESGPVYEHPEGSLVMLEYRDRGIAVQINWQGGVDGIHYLAEPYGAERSQCPPDGGNSAP